MQDKKTLKNTINQKLDELIDGVEKIGDLNFFEIDIKNVNGDLSINLKNTYKCKIK